MKRVSIIHFLIIGILPLLSCDKEVKFDATASRYFPLTVGNYWRLEPANPAGVHVEITVTEQVLIHGRNYFKLHETVREAETGHAFERDFYLHIDKNNLVYHLSDSAANINRNILRLGAPNGYRWSIESLIATVRTQSQEINGYVFDDCKSFSYDDPRMVDEEHAATYASGIGYLQIDGGWGRSARLAEALVDGTHHKYD
jgi:hypothetical protein